jgi:hypothetical protein
MIYERKIMIMKDVVSGQMLADIYKGFVTIEEANMLLGYVTRNGYMLQIGEKYALYLVDPNEPENEPVALYEDELITMVSDWNYELLLDDAVNGEWRKEILRDAGIIASIQDRWDIREGYCIGTPTVKELIAILSKLPQDYKVTCCGGENYLYRFEEGKCITIDNERSLN